MTTEHAPSATQTIPGSVSTRSDRLTITAGALLLAIAALHTLAFAFHPYWGAWLAGPLRTGTDSLDSAVQFWGLPGGFVVPGALLALLIIRLGRRGQTLPAYTGWTLGLWAALCLWIVGPSGFVFVLAPAILLVIAGRRARSSARRPMPGDGRTSRA